MLFRSRIVGLLLLALIGWWAWQKLTVTDEQRIRRTVGAMQRAVEKMNFLSLDSYIAGDYHDDRGLDKSSLLAAVRVTRLQYSTFLVFLSDTTVTVDPDRQNATVVFIAKVLATPRDGGAESELFTERFRLTFRKLDNAWKLTSTEVPKLKFE